MKNVILNQMMIGLRRYGLMIPVVEIDGKEVQYGHVDKKFIFKTLTIK